MSNKTDRFVTFCRKALAKCGTSRISRETAKLHGFMFYHSGGVCDKGHDAYRYMSTGNCRTCTVERNGYMNAGMTTEEYRAKCDRRKNLADKMFELELARIDDYGL